MRKTVFYWIVLAGLAVFSCVPAELDNIEAFVYTFPELEEIDPLPELELTPPLEVVVEDGSISLTEKTEELVLDVEEAVVDDDLTDTNLELIEDFSELAQEISDDELIETINEEWLTGIIDGTIEPSPELEALADDFISNEEFFGYLTQLDLPKVDGVVPGGRMSWGSSGPNELLLNPRYVERVLSLVTPCKLAAEALFLENVKKLEDQASAQKAEAKNYYDNLKNTRTSFWDQRTTNSLIAIRNTLNLIRSRLISFNRSVDLLRRPSWVKRGLKAYMAAWAIYMTRQYNQYLITAPIAYANAKATEIARIDQAYQDKIIEIESNLAIGINAVTEVYNTAVNNCHDQGSGG
jgi:hypothetical protein